MATTTPTLALTKQEASENASIAVLNTNLDKIDAFAATLSGAVIVTEEDTEPTTRPDGSPLEVNDIWFRDA